MVCPHAVTLNLIINFIHNFYDLGSYVRVEENTTFSLSVYVHGGIA